MKMNCFVLVALAVVMAPALSYIPCNPIDLQLALISANYTGSVIAQRLLLTPVKTRYAVCFICSSFHRPDGSQEQNVQWNSLCRLFLENTFKKKKFVSSCVNFERPPGLFGFSFFFF